MLFEFDDFVLDESAYELRQGGAQVKVDPKVLDVLAYMLRRPGQLVTKSELREQVWEGRALSETVLTGAISKLRKALGDEAGGKLVVNVYGRGYRFAGAVRSRSSLVPQQDAATDVVPSEPQSTPFVGRSAALSRIDAALGDARRGHGRIVAVGGEPGIGKTELCEVSGRRAAAVGVPSAWGHCRTGDGGPPFWPVIQVLRGALGSASSVRVRDEIGLALSSLMPDRVAQGNWGAETSSYRVLDTAARALRTLTEDQPFLLVLDDLQWADAASLRFLAYLAPEIAHLRLLVLVALRSTEAAVDQRLAAVLGHRNCEYFELERLTVGDVAEYTALRLGTADPGVIETVFIKSEGNPFFMVELLRPFHVEAQPRADELALSGPALDIVRQRVRGLSSEARTLLSVAAVVGREFDLGLLGSVTERDAETVLDLLDEARRNNTISPVPDHQGHFSFGHDLIRAVLLDELATSERSRLHLSIARALERRSSVSEQPSTELVHHLLSAAPLGDMDKAVDYAKRSALAATYVFAHADAAALLRRALGVLDLADAPRPRMRAELLAGLSQCERVSADSRFVEHLAEAVALAREHEFGDVLADAGRQMSSAPGFIALGGAREVLEAADRTLPLESAELRADVLAHLAWTAPYCFDKEKALSLVERAEALAVEASSPAALAMSLAAKLYFLSGPGAEAEARARELVERIERIQLDRPPLLRAYWAAQHEFSKVVLSLQRADVAGADRSIEAFGAAARELRHAELEWHYERACLVLRMNRGALAESSQALRKLEERARELQLFAAERVCSGDWAVLLRATAGAERLAPFESLLVPESTDSPCRLARKVRFLAEMGSLDRARAALDEHPAETLSRLPEDRDYLATLANLAVAAVATGRTSHAEALHALILPHASLFAVDIRLHTDGSMAHYAGILARALGRTDEAKRHLEAAFEHNERAGFPAHAAHSAHELARTLGDDRSSNGAGRRDLLNRALGEARRLGLEPLVRKVEGALGAG